MKQKLEYIKLNYSIHKLNPTFKILYLVLFVVISFIVWIISLIKNRKKIKETKITIITIFIGLYPYIWYATFAGHSTIHAFFTFRLQAISILALFCTMIEFIDIDKIKGYINKKRKEYNNERENSSINTML